MKSTKVTLYKNHLNNIGTWSIWFEGNTIFIEHASVIGGSAVRHIELVSEGKQSRTLQQQVVSRIKSRINKQLDKGYVKTYDEALKPPTNAMNMIQPMLAQPFKRVLSISNTMYVQPKLDGHRCLITRQNGKMLAYSRQGKSIDTIDHILNNIDIPEGTTLDGELYVHGEKLQTIASWSKRLQDLSKKLEYHVYDMVSDEKFSDRLWQLNTFNFGAGICRVYTEEINPYEIDLTNLLKHTLNAGYEGLILRDDKTGYQAGRRSKSLIKLKQTADAEFKVVDIKPSKTGWAVLTCITDEGREFGVSAPGTHEQKTHVLQEPNKYLERYVTVEFSQLTKDNIPFHPVAIRWRDDL